MLTGSCVMFFFAFPGVLLNLLVVTVYKGITLPIQSLGILSLNQFSSPNL